jgi:hypothetical protein
MTQASAKLRAQLTHLGGTREKLMDSHGFTQVNIVRIFCKATPSGE